MTFALILNRMKAGQIPVAKGCAQMIAFLESLDDTNALKECKAQAKAVFDFLASRRDTSVEEHNAAAKIKTRIEHRLGEVLDATVKRGRRFKGDRVSPLNGDLPEGIERKQSSRAQQVASIPWAQIERKIDAQTAVNEKAKPTRIIKEMLQEKQRKQNADLVAGTKQSRYAVTYWNAPTGTAKIAGNAFPYTFITCVIGMIPILAN